MKTCEKCKQTKLELGFQKNKNTKDGLQIHCKICRRVPPRPKRELRQVCSCCRVQLTIQNARRRGGNRSNQFRAYCIPCALKVGREYQLIFSEKIRQSARERRLKDLKGFQLKSYKGQIRRKYGLSWEDFLRLNKEQDGKCAICFIHMNPPSVDHCHSTGRVRGLLCKPCNHGLGLFKDAPSSLRAAASYLEKA